MSRPSDTVEHVRSAGKIYQLVSEFTAPVVVGLLVDWQFGTVPWGLAIGTLFGFLLGGYRVKAILKQLERDDAERVRKGGGP